MEAGTAREGGCEASDQRLPKPKVFGPRSCDAPVRAWGSRVRTLKTAQGRHSELKQRTRKIPVRSGRCGNSQIRLQFHLNSLRNGIAVEARSSEEERRVDAKALIADEGRDKLR